MLKTDLSRSVFNQFQYLDNNQYLKVACKFTDNYLLLINNFLTIRVELFSTITK